MSDLSPLLDEQRTTLARGEPFRFWTHLGHWVAASEQRTGCLPSLGDLSHLEGAG